MLNEKIQIKLVVTTSLNAGENIVDAAKSAAEKLSAPFQKRGGDSLPAIKKEYQAEAALVFSQDGPAVHTVDGKYFFHLSMAELRIKNVLNGKDDHMAQAMGLSPGMSVLDCTLGLGTDAIVASYHTGKKGRVVGLEKSPVLALIARMGLRNFSPPADEINLTAALRRIIVENIDYLDYLRALPAKSFDVVYFDPMFRHPVRKSSNLTPLRKLTDDRPLALEAVQEACRVAGGKVVMKEKSGSGEFEKLGFSDIRGGKHSRVKYGVILL